MSLDFLHKKSRALFLGTAVAALIAFWLVVRWKPDWDWISDSLAGTFSADPADPALVTWRGVWPDQILRSGSSNLHVAALVWLKGKRTANASMQGNHFRGEMEITRPFLTPPKDAIPFLTAELSASGSFDSPFPFLRQISATGAWRLSAAGSRRDAETAHWKIRWTGSGMHITFGPADRPEPIGSLALSAIQGEAEQEGLTLELRDLRGSGNGIVITGKGVIQTHYDDPLKSVLSLGFEVKRELGSAALQVDGWEEAIAGTDEMSVDIRGTLAEPVFYLNGFPLIEESLAAKQPVVASTLEERILRTSAANLSFQPDSPALPGDNSDPEAPTPYAGFSESDIRKMQTLLNSRVVEERKRTVEGHSPEYRKRWKELKQAYKDELKKLKAEGVDLRKEFGRKPNREMKKLIERQLSGEFPEESPLPPETEKDEGR